MSNRAIAPAADELEVTVLGPGTGESIVLHLPGLGWGVVDCCHDTLPYLKLMGVARLAFVALTHPHRDHYGGFEKLLPAFSERIDRVWIYSGNSVRELRRYQARAIQHGKGDYHGFGAVLDAFEAAKKAGAAPRTMSACKLLLQASRAVGTGAVSTTIHALSPSADDETGYFAILGAAMPREGELLQPLPDRDHNLVAAAMMISSGVWRICLGSDVENGRNARMGWQAVLCDETRPDLHAHIVKVSHHGSKGSHLSGAWEKHCGETATLVENAVVTPYGSSSLPRPDDLSRLCGVATAVQLTADGHLRKPTTVYPFSVRKKIRLLRNWRIVGEDLGHVRYRAPVGGGPVRIEHFGRATAVTRSS